MHIKIVTIFMVIFTFKGHAFEEVKDIEQTSTPVYLKEVSEEAKSTPLSEDEIITLLTEKHKGSVVGDFIDSNPRLTKLTVRVTLNEEIKKMWKDTLRDKTRYFLFVVFILLTWQINRVWKRIQNKNDLSFGKNIINYFYRSTAINISRVMFFIYLFLKEIRPVWMIVKKTFNF